MITLTYTNLYALGLITGLIGATLAVYGPGFLAWTDARRGVGNDADGCDEYRERAS